MHASAGNLKKGQFVLHNNQVWQVLKTDFNYRGRGSATVKVRIRNVATGAVIENTTKSDALYESPDVDAVQTQYLYKDDAHAFFMDPRDYEQHQVDIGLIGKVVDYLKEGDNVYLIVYNKKPISMRPPQTVRLKVIESEDAARGDTATAPKKTVTIETGVKVKVPLFIKKGDTIVVNPETGDYLERAA